MGGYPVAIVGYQVDASKVAAYTEKARLGSGGLSTRESIKALLMHLDKETSIEVTFARLEDEHGANHEYLCCFAKHQGGWIQDYSEMSAVQVPQKFTSVVQALSHDATVKRLCAANGQLNSFDASGRSRI